MPGFPVHHQLLELAQTHVHEVGDAVNIDLIFSKPSVNSLSCSSLNFFPFHPKLLHEIVYICHSHIYKIN